MADDRRERERTSFREQSERDRDRDRDRDRERDRDRDRYRERDRRDEEEVESGRAIFVGNIEHYCHVDDLENLFNQKGNVIRVDLKQGYAFVFLDSGHRDCIRAFDGYQLFGRRLKVELARGDGQIKRREDSRRREALNKPNETLFVVNFDPISTQPRDLDKLFGRYGEIKRIEMKRNFAFVQFSTIEEATKALEATNGTRLMDRQINVEFVYRGADQRSSSPFSNRKRYRSPSPRRRESPPYRKRYRSRSPSPNQRYRGDRDRFGRDPRPDDDIDRGFRDFRH